MYASTEIIMKTAKEISIRELSKSDIERFNNGFRLNEDGCWIWQKRLGKSGYGYFNYSSTAKLRVMLAHRISYVIYYGAIKKGLVIDHICRVKSCVNPNHLRMVTVKENIHAGIGLASINLRKTHCKNGHEFTKENTIVNHLKDGRKIRGCRKCSYAYSPTRYREKNKKEYLNKYRKANIERMRRYGREYSQRDYVKAKKKLYMAKYHLIRKSRVK